MAHMLKDNASTATPIPILPTGEQQIAVSIEIVGLADYRTSFFSIKVACRIRPMTDEEILLGATTISHKVANDNVRNCTEWHHREREKEILI